MVDRIIIPFFLGFFCRALVCLLKEGTLRALVFLKKGSVTSKAKNGMETLRAIRFGSIDFFFMNNGFLEFIRFSDSFYFVGFLSYFSLNHFADSSFPLVFDEVSA